MSGDLRAIVACAANIEIISRVVLFRQNKSCVQTLHGHAKDVYAVEFHPSMPLIISGASDGNTVYKVVQTCL